MDRKGGPAADPGAFERALSAVEEDGGAFLVLGDVPASAHERACDRWLGDAEERRHRLLVRTEGTRQIPAVVGSRCEVVTFGRTVRSAAAEGGGRPSTSANSLGDLGVAVADAVDRLEARAREPCDLRVCVEALTPLRVAAADDDVFHFLHLVLARVRAADGLAHVHVSAGRDEEVVRLFEPLFDGTVDLRVGADGVLQRWHLHEGDHTSEWLPLDGPADL